MVEEPELEFLPLRVIAHRLGITPATLRSGMKQLEGANAVRTEGQGRAARYCLQDCRAAFAWRIRRGRLVSAAAA
jgi:predicted ArsR family transcriptional regulator